ncbi:MAG: M50 family metallopeptidase [bacterium]
MTILAIIVFVLIFSLLVLAHEWGHFAAARRNGVGVEEFGLGLPPRIWGIKKGKTIYSINWIPFGGFVKLKGEGDRHPRGRDALPNQSYGVRILVTTGGVLMNFALAWVAVMIGFWLGMPPIASAVTDYVGSSTEVKAHVIVLQSEKGSPAEAAGLQPGDEIVAANGATIASVADLQEAIAGTTQAKLTVQRQQETLTITTAVKTQSGRQLIGIIADELIESARYTWWQVPYFALVELGRVIKMIAEAIYGVVASMLTTASLPDSIAGPVGIAKITAQAVQLGWLSVLQWLIFLSVNLGVINIVPFPALDGGRLLFLLVEIARGGRRVKPEIENLVHNLGFVLLLAFIFTVTYRDIVRLL